jgi:hypothetical protein
MGAILAIWRPLVAKSKIFKFPEIEKGNSIRNSLSGIAAMKGR